MSEAAAVTAGGSRPARNRADRCCGGPGHNRARVRFDSRAGRSGKTRTMQALAARVVEGESRFEPPHRPPVDLPGAEPGQEPPVRWPGGVLADHPGERRR